MAGFYTVEYAGENPPDFGWEVGRWLQGLIPFAHAQCWVHPKRAASRIYSAALPGLG